mgnify:CR=1 FL=1|jgi:Flp pilus assembly protein TadG
MTRPRCRGERGSVSLLVVILLPALLMAAGLVLDGGRQLAARREAAAAASAAARAAVQLTEAEAFAQQLDPALAVDRGQARLQAAGHQGVVAVDPGGVTVTVTASVEHLILPGARTVTATSRAEPQGGITQGAVP